MKTKSRLTAIAVAGAMALGTAALASAQQPAGAQQNLGAVGYGYCTCPMDCGMTGQGMGPGMMRQGMGPGTMQPPARDLETPDVERMMSSWLAWQRNPNLKLGKIEAKDNYIIVAEIVTKDGSLVQRYEVNRQTGWMRPSQ